MTGTKGASVNLFELLFFLLICLALGFLAHLIFPAWGWWVGAVAAAAVMLLVLAGAFRELFLGKSQDEEKQSNQ
jgi:membrane protein implicated in regulation of membrane protease activity